MFESISNSDHWSTDDSWCGSKEILMKSLGVEVNQIPLLGIIEMGIMNLVLKDLQG